jgi:mannose-6-phosphate isomerase-like protein (cupin superfamily)
MNKKLHLKFDDYRWDTVPLINYKEVSSKSNANITFNNITRQNIITKNDGVDFEVRLFECGPDGFSTLEKHQHTHIVMIARGTGKVIIGENIYDASPLDYFIIPEWHPHQLINTGKEPFAFFCTVNANRDNFKLLSNKEVEQLRENKDIDKWIQITEEYWS